MRCITARMWAASLLAEIGQHLGAERVQFGLELVELGGSGGFWAWVWAFRVDQELGTGGSGALTEHVASS